MVPSFAIRVYWRAAVSDGVSLAAGHSGIHDKQATPQRNVDKRRHGEG